MPKNKREDSSSSDSDPGVEDEAPPPKKVAKNPDSIRTDDKDEPTWALSHNKLVKIRNFKNKTYVDIREHYEKDGKQLAGKKGIMLPVDLWKKLMSASAEINEALKSA